MDDEEFVIHRHVVDRLLDTEQILATHSMFAYPHLFVWHALFDGTWLCRCWHSKVMRSMT